MIKTRKGALLLIFFADTQLDCFVPICFGRVCRTMLPWLLTDISIKIIGVCIFAEQLKDKSE